MPATGPILRRIRTISPFFLSNPSKFKFYLKKQEPLSLEYQHLLNPQHNLAIPAEELKRAGLEIKSLEDPDSTLIKQEDKNGQNGAGSDAKSEEKTSDVKKEGDNLNDLLASNQQASLSPKNGASKRPYNKKTMEKIKRWTKEESSLYEQFIEMYADIFNDPSSKRVTKIFIFMSKYIGTKTPSQCRSHHQKFFKKIQGMKSLGGMNPAPNNSHLQRNKEGLEELNKFQNSEKKKRGKYSKKQNMSATPNNEEINKNLNPFDFPFDDNLKMQFKHQFENDPTGSFLAYPGMFNLNSFSQNPRPQQQDNNLMNMYSQLNNNIRKSFEMLNKEYGRKPQGSIFKLFLN